MKSARRPEECDKPEKYARRAQRIVDAAITFGLIEPQDESTKSLKPLRATDRLHALMMEVGGARVRSLRLWRLEMDVFISYSRSARDAEREFLKLYEQLWSDNRRQSTLGTAGGGGWSRMLPGIVCDLDPEVSDSKIPAFLIGLMSDESLISCDLEQRALSVDNSEIQRLLDVQRRSSDLPVSMHRRESGRINLFSKIMDGSVSVRRFARDVGLQTSFRWSGRTVMDRQNDPTIVSILELARDKQEGLDNRLADLFRLFSGFSKEMGDPLIVRRLTREYNCRFAWSSIQLDRLNRLERWRGPVMEPDRVPDTLGHKEVGSDMRTLRSFWEKQELAIEPDRLFFA